MKTYHFTVLDGCLVEWNSQIEVRDQSVQSECGNGAQVLLTTQTGKSGENMLIVGMIWVDQIERYVLYVSEADDSHDAKDFVARYVQFESTQDHTGDWGECHQMFDIEVDAPDDTTLEVIYGKNNAEWLADVLLSLESDVPV